MKKMPCLQSILVLAIVATGIAVGSDTIQADENASSYRVVTYNIKRCWGNDSKTDLTRTAAVLENLTPDFIGLQEVDNGTRRSGGVDQATELGRRLDMNSAFGSFMKYDGGLYGMAVLSKHPIMEFEEVKLPTGNEPRIALSVQVKLPSGESLKIVNVHFDWVSDDGFRFAQATRLREYLDRLEMPYVLLGDFNDQPGSRTLELLSQRSVAAEKPSEDRFTFSSSKPIKEIDFIFAAPESKWQFENVKVIDEPVASDHRPVFAELTRTP
jgi:endonuclease/exonuclease/phosphatase family metal-dependent hydrolase